METNKGVMQVEKKEKVAKLKLFLGQGHAGNEAVSSVAYVGQKTFLKYARPSS